MDFICFLIIFTLMFPPIQHSTEAAACNPLDKQSLLPLATNFPSLNWSVVDCCSWNGISCDDKTNRVVELSIPDKHLHGVIPSSLQNLTFLTLLNLSFNSFYGPLPKGFFSSFNNLKIIDLSYNSLFGHLSYPLPATLQSLNFSSNHITGTIPNTICTISPALVTLDFSSNDFTGNIPLGFSACSNLRVLSLGFNNLTGRMPIDIDGARSLQQLSLPGNSLVGEIGESITNLTNLRSLVLFGNMFSGSIPHNIGKLSLLERLELHINYINGTIPLSLMNCTKLTLLNLRVNSLVGRLADIDFSNFSQLRIIDLGENQLNGVLPRTLFNCKLLNAIRLSRNRLEGEVLSDVLDLSSLSFLSLADNTLTNITGAIDVLRNLTKLTTLILSNNFYNETLPDGEISGFHDLEILALGGCHLFGQIPTWLRSLTNLEVIDFSQNFIIGTIPGWLQTLPNLFYLDLSNNDLSGGLPVELTRLPALNSQEVLDHVNSSYLQLPVFIAPQKVYYLQYNQLRTLPSLYLGSNHLSGDIPNEIGRMKSLHVLDLSQNNFSGSIPIEISNLTNLEMLDLSHNHLSSEIPSSLKSLYFLTSFNVAHNDLQGPIPEGVQLATFSIGIYEDNPKLCGTPLKNPCGIPSATTNSSSGHEKGPNTKRIVGLILGISAGGGITLTCLALWILSKQRIPPSGDPPIFHSNMVSFNSTSAVEVPVDTGRVILFPNNAKYIKNLTIADILIATDNFSQSNIIGCGGFGLVYKATFPGGTKLAIKKLSGNMGLITREFEVEVEALSTAQHKNLISLQGYCVDDGCQMLIYSYMENGSLEYWLHEKTNGASILDWPTRLKIAQGASCGLAYLHQVCEPHIVHRDIKSGNILLDDKFEAHLADFGLSRLIQPYNTHVTTDLVGTLGYIPPEYAQSRNSTLRGDIYSFGIVMLELLTGNRPIEVFRPQKSRESVAWVQKLRIEGKQDEVFDTTLRCKGHKEEMLQVLDIACMCVKETPSERPTISEVVDRLRHVGPNHRVPK